MNLYKPIKLRKFLYPLSWLYGFVIFIRNKCFDWKIIKQHTYSIPIICVGNITAGGTGKTPHTEYLIKILLKKYRVGVISRGYKRKSKGFILASNESTCHEIGDEPYQIKQKFPTIILAVDSNRRRGICNLMQLDVKPQVIIMDDGFQHRYVKPSLSIVLSNYNRPIYRDKLIPVGLLRETLSCLSRAGVVLVTKCPTHLVPLDFRIISHDLNLLPYQLLGFTSFAYSHLTSVFSSDQEKPLDYLKNKHILVVTGIASPATIIDKLNEFTSKIEVISFKDHHSFTQKDLLYIQKRYDSISSIHKLIVTTEKDASKLVLINNMKEDLKAAFYSLPIEVKFLNSKTENNFKEYIYKHVKENTGNSRFPNK